MKSLLRWSLILAALVILPVAAQKDYRLRVTVDLVQVDATVTDASGNPVTDLKASDFRVLLDGKPQELKYCSYMPVGEPRSAAEPHSPLAPPVAKSNVTSAQPSMPAGSIKREQVRRTIVLFVGDLLTSAESMPGIRAGLTKFVKEQLQPGDLVAVVRSSAGLGALQDFTPDKNRLLAAIDLVRWTPNAVGIGGASAYDTIGDPSKPPGYLNQPDTIAAVERATLATTASLLKLIQGMADLPGRKSVILVSDALRLSSPDEMDPMTGSPETGTGMGGPIYPSMRRIVDESVRAGVVLYAIDTRGLSSLRGLASDHVSPAGGTDDPTTSPQMTTVAKDPTLNGRDWVWQVTQSRRDEYTDKQWGALFLTSETGGFMVTESNRIDAGLSRIMQDQRGYYLLGFQPPSDAMELDNMGHQVFHSLKVQVLRPGLKVRSHAGFFGAADEEMRQAASPELQLMASLESPFQASEISLDVETSYLSEKNDYFLRATLFIDARDVLFAGPPIHRTGVLHVVLRAFNATGGTLEGGIDQMRRIDLNEDGYERAQKYGLIYTTLLPVKKPGPYQVRAACRDEATGHIGTGGDFVSIPKPKSTGIRLGGIIFPHALGIDDHVVPSARPIAYPPGQNVRFVVQIIPKGISLKPEAWALQTRLFRDGIEVWKSAPAPIEPNEKKAPLFLARGSLTIPNTIEPGKYLVRVDLSDKSAPESVLAWQWGRLTVE